MRILFDQGTPVQIRRSLNAHSIRTAREQGWSTLANGELLRVAEEAAFDLFLTTDKNLRYQQNLSKRKIAIVVLGNGLWPFVRPMLAQVAAAIEAAEPGSYTEVEIHTRQKKTGNS
jgi:glutamate racemase